MSDTSPNRENEKDREYYLNLRNLYHPDELKHIFILESPPCSGLYFYDESRKKNEFLFNEMMKFLQFKEASNKKAGLEYFQKCGYLLVDATYQQINNERNKKKRNDIILDDFSLLIEDLKTINPDKKIPLILVKANICRILEPRLKEKGFNVLNKGVGVPFPCCGWQKKFHEQIGRFYKHQNSQEIKK